ncbi:DUF5615 family PIN-like protein [Segetibacter sp. 3557_3]|uniref:DUF5615 family PIN-like protein n=1 Tax=Segetibacter sp. 3557_3 TaxID=2547429 RepID=UPI001404A530|nr:DUF5615 family PIN-like protein [Segetibacter sp. 3557_3]
MRILLDENLPKQLKNDFSPEHDVKTVRDMGWQGKKNGELLGLFAADGFDFFVTIDKNLRYQQNLYRYDVKILLLTAKDNRKETLRAFVEKIQHTIRGDGKLQQVTEVS